MTAYQTQIAIKSSGGAVHTHITNYILNGFTFPRILSHIRIFTSNYKLS